MKIRLGRCKIFSTYIIHFFNFGAGDVPSGLQHFGYSAASINDFIVNTCLRFGPDSKDLNSHFLYLPAYLVTSSSTQEPDPYHGFSESPDGHGDMSCLPAGERNCGVRPIDFADPKVRQSYSAIEGRICR